MLLKDLLEKVRSLESFSEKEKNKLLRVMTRLSVSQLQELASLILWYEEQEKHLQKEETGILHKIKTLFIKMNQYAAKNGITLSFKRREEKEKTEDLKTLNRLLDQL